MVAFDYSFKERLSQKEFKCVLENNGLEVKGLEKCLRFLLPLWKIKVGGGVSEEIQIKVDQFVEGAQQKRVDIESEKSGKRLNQFCQEKNKFDKVIGEKEKEVVRNWKEFKGEEEDFKFKPCERFILKEKEREGFDLIFKKEILGKRGSSYDFLYEKVFEDPKIVLNRVLRFGELRKALFFQRMGNDKKLEEFFVKVCVELKDWLRKEENMEFEVHLHFRVDLEKFCFREEKIGLNGFLWGCAKEDGENTIEFRAIPLCEGV